MDNAADQKAEGIKIYAKFLQQLSDIQGVAGARLMASIGISSTLIAITELGLRVALVEAV